jgi:hypothetical protein
MINIEELLHSKDEKTGKTLSEELRQITKDSYEKTSYTNIAFKGISLVLDPNANDTIVFNKTAKDTL